MPATDNSAVQITINVVDGATGETISRVTKNLDKLGEAGVRNGRGLKTGMDAAGEAGARAGKSISDGMDSAGAHSLTALDNVRLLRDDLGIRIPRAMEQVIAKSQLLSGIIGSVGTGFIALGALEIGVRLGTQVYELYERWLDVNKAVKEYTEKAAQAAEQKLFNEGSFDTTLGFLRQAGAEVDKLQAKKTARQNSSLLDNIFLPNSTAHRFTTDDDKHLAQATEIQDQTGLRNLQQSHEMMLKNIDDHEKLSKASATSAGAITVERRAARERDQENLSYAKSLQQQQVDIYNRAHQRDPKKFPGTYTASKDAGQQEFSASENSADIGSQAASTQLAFQQQKDLMALRQQADAVGLHGERELAAQRISALTALDEKYKGQTEHNRQYKAEEDEINRRFDNEETQRLREQTSEVAKRVREASTRGLTGLAATDAHAAASKADIDSDLGQGKYYGNREQQQQYATGLKGAVDLGANAEREEQQKQFTDRLQQLDASRSDRYASESDRITSSAQHTVAEITKAWTDMYGKLAPLDARRVQSQQALNDEIGKINADAAKQRQEAGQRVEDETSKVEDEARRAGLPKYQQETTAIVDEYNERYRKLEELRAQDSANSDRYRRQELAEQAIANGKLLEQQRALRDQLAGTIQGFLSNPLEALKRQGEQSASRYAADALLKYAPGVGTAIAGGGRRGGGGDGPFGLPSPKIFGGGFGGQHPATVDAGNVSPSINSDPLGRIARGGSPISASSTTLTAATATITVGTATIFGGGGGGGGGGSYAPIGGGAYFDTGSKTAGGASAGASGSGTVSEAGVGSSISGSIGAVQSTVTDIGAIGKTLGIGGSGSGQGTTLGDDPGGVWDEAGAAANPGTTGAGAASAGKAAGGLGSKAGGLIGGGIGLFNAYEGKGGFGGALSGALSGAQFGGEIGGPIGAGIGAAAGAVLGFIGFGARAKAEKYYGQQVKPRIHNDLTGFEAGQTDYQSAFDDMTNLITEAKVQTRQMGSGAESYYNDTINPAIKAAQTRMTAEQKAGRADFGMTAAQFHNGGIIRDFGSMSTSNGQGWIHAQIGETVLNQQAAITHNDAAMLMNAGASRSDMASYYGGSGGTRQAASSGGETNLHFHAPDAKGMYQLFMDNRHTIRAAVNASSEENSGGGDYA